MTANVKAIRARTVRIKTPDVEAMQHDGTPEMASAINAWLDEKAPKSAVFENTPGMWVVLFLGPQVVRVYDDETFRSVFELTDEGSTR